MPRPPPQKLTDDLDDYWKAAPKKGEGAPAAAVTETAPAVEEAAAE